MKSNLGRKKIVRKLFNFGKLGMIPFKGNTVCLMICLWVLFWFQYLVVANLIQFEKFQVDSVEIKENVCAFAWEPVGSKFAIIHGESQSMNVSFYSVTTGNIITFMYLLIKLMYSLFFLGMLIHGPCPWLKVC